METYYETELHLALASRGNRKFWQGFAVTDGDNCYTRSESWQLKENGTESKHIVSAPKIATAKNVGRANEVAPREQAILEIKSALGKKRDTGYVTEDEPPTPARPLPMLAHPFEKRKHNIKYPAYVQPKLDGTRMLFDGTVGWSRRGKDYLPEVIAHFACDIPDGILLDGELMLNQDDFTFQQTISAIKKFDKSTSPYLQFNVYDLIDTNNPDRTFIDRYDELTGLVGLVDNDWILLVLTPRIVDEDGVKGMHTIFVDQGYEGAIIRNEDGIYKAGARSANLQKYKHFEDDEFTITDVVDGVGKEVGCAIFICENTSGGTFRARPRGTVETRRRWYVDRAELVGKSLTVRYQELTDDGIPRFPVGISIRDYE